MNSQLLRALYRELFHSGKPCRPRRCKYDDNLIVFIHFLAVLQNASMRWAHDRCNWPLWLRRLPKISYSELMRRLNTESVRERIMTLNRTFRQRLPQTAEKAVDGKPLIVGAYSKDTDAKLGYVAKGHWARGYKLHAVADSQGAIDAFCITGLNAGETTVARQSLLPRVDWCGVVLRGDANYDSNRIYEILANHGGRFLAPRSTPGAGLRHGFRNHPDRLRAVIDLEHDASLRREHCRHRARIEQCFGHLTNLPFGLFALPNSVRRLYRVERWVAAKIALYHLYLSLNNTQAEAA